MLTYTSCLMRSCHSLRLNTCLMFALLWQYFFFFMTDFFETYVAVSQAILFSSWLCVNCLISLENVWLFFIPRILKSILEHMSYSLSMYMILSMYYWIWFANIWGGVIFAFVLINNIGLQFSFFEGSLSGFCIREMLASWNEFGRPLSFPILQKSLRMICINSLWMFGRIH